MAKNERGLQSSSKTHANSAANAQSAQADLRARQYEADDREQATESVLSNSQQQSRLIAEQQAETAGSVVRSADMGRLGGFANAGLAVGGAAAPEVSETQIVE